MGRRSALFLLALVLTAAACSDDTEDRAYFEDLRAMTTAYGSGLAVLPVASTNGDLGDAMRYFEGVNRLLQDTSRQLAVLTPPDRAVDAHAAFLTSLEAYAGLAEDLAAQGRRMQVPEDLLRLANDPVFGVANSGVQRDEAIGACGALQDLADERDYAIDLECASLAAR